jgi:Mlc titration factor MtfA (ptsG expression regulator)
MAAIRRPSRRTRTAQSPDRRSPDIYETSSPLEFVAVNMEYFLLDPSYACRRPSLYRYYKEHFGWAPPQGCLRQNLRVPECR